MDVEVTPRGKLHIYLGAVPGVGKTFAMLGEGRRLRDGGADTVVGLVETHGRADLENLLDDMECVQRRGVEYHGARFEELDLDAVLARRPQVVLIDELAHTNVPGSYHSKRWQDVATLLEQGIDVVSTVNVQHIESMDLAVEAITGIEQYETVPDIVIEAAELVDLVDAPTAVLRDRLAAGLIFSPGRAELARDASLQTERIDALRSLAKHWLEEHRARCWPRFGGTRRGGVVVAALTGTPEGERVIRRARELASVHNAVVIGVHVREPTGLVEVQPTWLDRQRRVLAECGGTYAEVAGVDVVGSVLEFARAEHADDLVIGSTRRSRTDELVHGPVVSRFVTQAGSVEVHVVPAPSAPQPLTRVRHRPPLLSRPRVAIPARRRKLGWWIASLLPVAVLLALLPARSSIGVAGALFAVLVVVVLSAAVGGRGPALLATFVGTVLADFLFTVPYYSLRVSRLLDVVALVAFAVAAIVIGTLVDLQARQGVRIATADAIAEGLARLAADLVAEQADIPAHVLDSLRRTFDLEGLSLLDGMEHGWEVLASAGTWFPRSPADAAYAVELSATQVVALGRSRLKDADPQLLRAFVTELDLARETEQLRHLAR